MKAFIVAALFALLIAGSTIVGGSPSSKPSQTSNVVSYNARTDFALVPLPTTIPSMGAATGAGDAATDPDFHARIYRLTDINTLPGARFPAQQVWQMNCGGWADWRVSNVDSTKIFICHNGGGIFELPFDPATGMPGHARQILGATFPQWSKTQKDVAFAMASSDEPEIVRLDFSGPSLKMSTVVNLAKVPNCAEKDFAGGLKWREFSAAWDDSTFAVAATTGVQDTAHMIYVWNAKTGCQAYDTQAGTVNGAQITGSSERFQIHAIKLSGDGKVVLIAPYGVRERHFWRVGTTEVDTADSTMNFGHYAMGYAKVLNTMGRTSDRKKWCKLGIALRSLTALTSPAFLLTSQQCADVVPQGDDHLSWNNDDTSDNQPFATSTVVNPFGAPITAPWQDEILVFTQDGTVHREAHTFNSGNAKFFTCQNAIGSISQDGKWFFYSSDWEGTLGTNNAGEKRCDDFAVALH
jgi:hypothetical protein